MRTPFALLGSLLLMSASASAEELVSHHLVENYRAVECRMVMETDAGSKMQITLGKGRDPWGLQVGYFSPDPWQDFHDFFKPNRFLDREKIDGHFRTVNLGGTGFAARSIYFPYLTIDELDDDGPVIFFLKSGRRDVADAVRAINTENLSVPGLISIPDTSTALAEFRECAADAMWLWDLSAEGERS